jgi:predicted TIM-barrel fold metal-dependent hydrolase
MANVRVVDAHTHWWKDMNFFPPGFQWAIADVGANFLTHPPLDAWDVLKSGAIGSENFLPLDPDGKRYLADQDYCGGISASVILPLDWGMVQHYDQTYPKWREDAGYTQDEINKHSAEMAKWYPGRVFSFAGVDPRRYQAVKIFEKAVTEYGAIGLKLYPPCGFTADDPKCYPLYQKCLELDVPVLIHSGYTFCRALYSMTSHPKYIEQVAIDFPDLKIIIAHSGIQTNASTAWWEDAMGIARTKWNVFLDLAAWNEKVVGLTNDIPRLLRMLRTEMDIIGAHRVLFGTDLPGFQLPDDRDHSKLFVTMLKNLPEVGKEHGLTFSWEETELIAGRNAQRIYKLPDW